MKAHRSTINRSKRRRGFLSLELALSLPILVLVLMAIFEFSMLLAARGDVANAGQHGARLATQPGVRAEDVQQRVLSSLPPWMQENARVDVQLGERPGDAVVVAVGVPMRAASPDLLWPVGFGLRGRTLHVQACMLRE